MAKYFIENLYNTLLKIGFIGERKSRTWTDCVTIQETVNFDRFQHKFYLNSKLNKIQRKSLIFEIKCTLCTLKQQFRQLLNIFGEEKLNIQ